MTLFSVPGNKKDHLASVEEASPTFVTATFTGEDHPNALTNILSAAALENVTLVDFRQTVVQKRLTLVIELKVAPASREEAILYRTLLSEANALSLRVDCDFSPGDIPPSLTNKCAPKKTPRQPLAPLPFDLALTRTSSQFAITLLSPTNVTPHFLSKLSEDLGKYGLVVESISRLSASNLRCLELIVGTKNALTPTVVSRVRKDLFAIGRSYGLDVALQAESVLRRSKRLVVFDMDSTLIQQEVIDELARYAGVYDEVCAITNRAMMGEIDFRESLAQRCALLAGAPAHLFDKVIANLHYTPGAKQLCRTLKRLGYRLAVISGGFTRVTAHVRNELGLDYDYANQLEEVDGVFTGRTVGPVVSAQRKADLLMTIAQLENVTLDQVIGIGDGANDLPMLGTAGVGIAFNAKPAVQEAARFRINQSSLRTVLYLLGISEQDQEELNGSGSVKTNGSSGSPYDG